MKTADTFSVLFWKAWAEFKRMSKPLMAGAIIWAALTTAATLAAGEVDEATAVTVRVAARVLGFTILALVVSFAANVFFMAMALEGRKTVGDAMNRVLPLALPVFGASLWMLIRSYVWVALIGAVLLGIGANSQNTMLISIGALVTLVGIILAIIFGPRFSLSLYIMLMEKKGIVDGANESHRRTRGYWGKIVGNSLLLGLCMLPVALLSLIIVAILGGSLGAASVLGGDEEVGQGMLLLAGAVGGVFNSWVTLLISAFSLYFWKDLTKTVTAHPRPAIK